jgi:prepilin-type N-terminal cleavage/methylation domain-containing protein
MLRINKQGFTLIELMVVIVIIGVLASLAIPRFTEASLKAKVAEAPGVLKGFESAFLAAIAEKGEGEITADELIYKAPEQSKWFSYSNSTDNAEDLEAGKCVATAQQALKSAFSGMTLTAEYDPAVTKECFKHVASSNDIGKLVPNFEQSGCQDTH